ncbi:MAG: dCTP deaminase [Candidatus Poseidoniia archaeon]|nr:dCTP deaminase [Candidatus Poseidoniia archaeon]
MPVLSDEAILAAIDAGQLEIEPFDVANLTPNGYDLSIGEVALAGSEPISEGALSVPPQTRFAVSTLERVACGSALCGQLWLRSTWARRGVQASFGKVDAGFDGTLTLPGFNSAAEPLELTVGETYCQLVLEALTSPASGSYSERSGNYQHQRGVTW